MVVEDEMALQNAIKDKLEKSGFGVLTARSVEEAIQKVADSSFDAIWLDHYLLGEASGLDFVAKCKEDDSSCKNIPIFVVSNTASPDKVQAYLKLGINKYYVKAELRLDDIINDIHNELG